MENSSVQQSRGARNAAKPDDCPFNPGKIPKAQASGRSGSDARPDCILPARLNRKKNVKLVETMMNASFSALTR